ncbi:unnamed protein product [Ectocarpus sp. 6 AP-2014]
MTRGANVAVNARENSGDESAGATGDYPPVFRAKLQSLDKRRCSGVRHESFSEPFGGSSTSNFYSDLQQVIFIRRLPTSLQEPHPHQHNPAGTARTARGITNQGEGGRDTECRRCPARVDRDGDWE